MTVGPGLIIVCAALHALMVKGLALQRFVFDVCVCVLCYVCVGTGFLVLT